MKAKKLIPLAEISVEKSPVSGIWLVAAMINNRRVAATYYGCKKREAVQRFRQEYSDAA